MRGLFLSLVLFVMWRTVLVSHKFEDARLVSVAGALCNVENCVG